MFNVGSVFFGSNTTRPVPPGTPTGASNGDSVDAVSNEVVLGNDLGDVAKPAMLLSDREIDVDNFTLFYKFNVGSTDSIAIRALQIALEDNQLPGFYALSDIRPASIALQTIVAGVSNTVSLLAGAIGASIVVQDVINGSPAISLNAFNGTVKNATLNNDHGFLRFLNGLNQQILNVDLTNRRRGIGNNVPDSLLVVSTNASNVLPAPPANTIVHVSGNTGSISPIVIDNYAGSVSLLARRASGTAVAPTALLTGSNVLLLSMSGYGTTGFSTNKPMIAMQSDENWTDTANGTRLLFGTVLNGTITTLTRMVIGNSGNVCIGSTLVPTAVFQIGIAGTAAVSGAAFKYTAGVLAQTVVEDGAKNFDGVNESLAVSGVTYILAKTLTATAALDFPNTVAGASSDLTITLTGAANGDSVVLGVPIASQVANGVYSAFVSAANTITVRFSNNDLLLPFDPASGTFRVSIIKY